MFDRVFVFLSFFILSSCYQSGQGYNVDGFVMGLRDGSVKYSMDYEGEEMRREVISDDISCVKYLDHYELSVDGFEEIKDEFSLCSKGNKVIILRGGKESILAMPPGKKWSVVRNVIGGAGADNMLCEARLEGDVGAGSSVFVVECASKDGVYRVISVYGDGSGLIRQRSYVLQEGSWHVVSQLIRQ